MTAARPSRPDSRQGLRRAGVVVVALEGMTFDVAEGSAFAIVGENGSGKSTLLDLLLGTTQPFRGR